MAKIYAPDPPEMQSTCAKCGHANREAAHFCAGCGAPLASACASCGAELAPSARFCDACGAAAAPGSEGGRAARKTLTVVFADLAGSTALQERLDPESARRVMTRFYDEMRDVLEAHGGRLEKLIGDAVVGVFGRPSVREDDALRAVRAAAAMVSALDVLNEELDRSWGVQLRMRTGVNTGELVVGDTGELIGDTMNVAARLEQAAPEGEVLVGQPTWRLVHHAVELEPVEPLLVKGKSERLAAWRVVSAAAVDPGRAGSIETPLVGREPELDRLRVVFDGVLAGRACRLVTVVGAPGVGKSRLVHELGVSLAERATVVEGHCEPTGEGITFLPVAEILRVIAGVGEADLAETVRDKLRLLTAADDPDRERLVESVAGVLGISEPASAQETFWALRRGVEFLARERPLVLILDDLHWGQPMLLDLVEHLVEWVRDAPVLLVALARPELREEREALVSAGRRAVDVIELEPLDQQESLELVGHLLGDVRVPVALSARILETTEGNPLFLGETLRMLVDEGALRRDGDGWVAREGIEAVEVPPTIQALLAARIERLRADERTVIERASVIGKQFYRGAVAELVSPPVRLAIDGHLEALRRKDMVEPEGTYWIDEPVYRFHHVLVRDAAYRSLLKEARAELHERFADWLEVKAGELVGEHEEVIAFHLEQAHEYRRQLGPLDERGRALGKRAAERLGSAGRRALVREDLAAAANLLSRALARDAGEKSRLLWDLCDAVLSAGDTASAAPLVGRYTDACGNERADAARARVLRGQLANLTGAPDVSATALSLIESAATLAEQGDQEGEARAHQVAAGAYARLGQVGAVEEELDRALATARAAGDRRRTTAVLAAAPRAALWGPSPVVRASGRCLDVVRILRMTPGNRHVEAVALRCQAVLEAMRGRVHAAREILAACRTTLEELGLGFELNETAVHAGIVELLADEPVAACEHLRAARAGFEALGAAAGAAQAAALLARALVTVGDPDALAEAIEQSEFAEAHSGEDLKTVIIWTSARAQALGRRGDLDSALSLARHASTLAEPTDALADKGDSALALADVLLAAERGEEAREVANSAAGWYEAKGHTVGAERSRQLADTAAPRAATVTPRPAAQSPAPAAPEVLGDRPPERYWKEFLRRFAARDATALADLHALGWTAVDHREMPWDSLHGRDEAERFYRSAFEVAPQTSAEVDEILACSDRVIAMRTTWRGSGGALGGDFEFRVGFVDVIENGLSVGREQYAYDDDDAMLARFTALSADDPEGFWRRYKALYDAHDLDGLLGLIDDDWVMVDHRRLGWVQRRGIDGARKQLASGFELSADLRVEIEEELAGDGRVLAACGAWRGSSAKGDPVEIPFGMVVVVDGERWVSADLYEPDDRRAMIARYAELGGGQRALADQPPERHLREWIAAHAARDMERLKHLRTPGASVVDHRPITGPDGGGAGSVRAGWEVTEYLHLEIDEVLACDDRVIAFRATWRGALQDGGGRFEGPSGYVTLVENGRGGDWHHYEPDERDAILARFGELSGRRTVLGDRLPERYFAEWTRRWVAGDLDSLPDLYGPQWVLVEHRALAATKEVLGPEDIRPLFQSILDAMPDSRFEIDEVLACDERVIALDATWRGSARDGGGPVEVSLGIVAVIEDGLQRRMEVFEPGDCVPLIACYAELGGGLGPLGERPPERWWKWIARAVAARDRDALAALWEESYEFVDHRAIGWDDTVGPSAALERWDGIWEGSSDVRLEVQDVLACDERTIALRVDWRGAGQPENGGGEFVVPVCVVVVIESDQAVRWEQFEPEDRDAVLVRYAALSGLKTGLGERPPERHLAEWIRRFGERDLEGALALYAEDWVLHEHRSLATMEAVPRTEARALLGSYLSISPDIRLRVDEVLACDERVIAARVVWRGTARDGGGSLEVAVGLVEVVEDGLERSVDQFDSDDRPGMIARYVELGGGLGPLGERPPERWFRRLAAIQATRDREQLPGLYAEDYRFSDHRLVGWEPTTSRREAAQRIKSIWDGTTDVHLEVHEVLACDERALALRLTWESGANADVGGGHFAFPLCAVVLLDGEQAKCWDQYEPEDRDAALARFAELTEGDHRRDRPRSERVNVAITERYNAHDLPGLMRHYAPDVTAVDHRKLGWEPLRGAEQVEALYRSIFQTSPDVRWEAQEILAADEDTIAVVLTILGTANDGSGELEYPFGHVTKFRGDRVLSSDFHEAEDRTAMIARYAELGGGQGPLGDRAPERHLADVVRAWARRDPEALLALQHPDFVRRDHRALGMEELRGRDAIRQAIESVLATSPSLRFEVDEVLACDERVIAARVAWRGAARDGGGEAESVIGIVDVVQNGLTVSRDQYDYNDADAMRARFAELGDRARRAPERCYDEWIRRWDAHDLDGVIELYAEDWIMSDRRSLKMVDDHRGRAQARILLASIRAMSDDLRFEIDELLACDERVLAARIAWRGTARDGGGQVEVLTGFVSVVEDGRQQSLDQYDVDDYAAMIARYAELGGGQGPLGDQPPAQLYVEFARRYARRDLDGMVELYADEFVLVDHRLLGWDEVTDREGVRALTRSGFDNFRDLRFEVDEVIACDERVIAIRIGWRGHALQGGGAVELQIGNVGVVEGGRLVRVDQYEPEDREAMLDRFTELAAAGARPRGELFYEEALRRFNAHDVDALVAGLDEHTTYDDHRDLPWEPLRGREDFRRFYRSMFEISADMQARVQEVLASDDHVIAIVLTVRGTGADDGGEFEYTFGNVLSFRADGLVLTQDAYELAARTAMVARYAELGGGQRPLGDSEPERWCAAYVRCVASHDLVALADRYAEDWVFNDHRTLGWETVRGLAGVVELQRSGYDTTLDLRAEVDEVLACGERAIAFRMRFVGHSVEGGGAFEISAGWVMEIVDGRARSSDMYEPDDVEGMLARFAELSEAAAAGPLGNRPPERFSDAYARALRTRDLEQIAALYDEDYVLVDHRPLGWEPIHGRTAAIEVLRRSIPRQPNIELEFDNVLACDDRVIALRLAWRGHGVKAGEVVYPVGNVNVLKDGRWHSCDVYPDEDYRAMIARYAELGGGQGPLGDRPPERYLASWIQAHAARDMNRLAELTANPTVVDHRTLGWEQVLGEKHASDAVRSGWEVTAFFHLEVDEVLACDDRVIAARIAWRGSMLAGGGLFEIPAGLVVRVESGLAVGWDLYEPDDRAAMLARFSELSGRREAAGRAPERLRTEYARRWATRDLDALLELYAEDWTMVDHRSLGMEPASGIEAARAVLASTLSMSPDLRFEVDEVLAEDDRVMATCMGYRGHASDGSGEAELLVGYVSRVIDERLVSTELFEPEDRQAMIARYAELGGGQGPLGDRPPERFWAEFCQRWAAGDLERIVELYADDWVAIEHRKLGWQEMHGPEQAREHVRSVLAGVGELRFEVEQVLGCDDRVIALIVTLRGTMGEHGGEWENRYGYLTDIRAGRLARLERYDHDDCEAMLARFAELSSARPDTPERDAAA